MSSKFIETIRLCNLKANAKYSTLAGRTMYKRLQ
jgi:hypothetical protein